ncbi:MAG: phosphonopyruvate decarboxylase [Acidimicrobiales bacterium]
MTGTRRAAEPGGAPTGPEPGWVGPTHRALIEAGVTVIGHVPDGGLSHLIIRLEADERVEVVRLTTEEEGVALLTGVWLGGGRGALLMQSSGVGNCTNMLGLLETCRVPGFLLVTMRGQDGESNPWQVPMGRAAGRSLSLMGIDVRSAASSDAVAGTVTRALTDSFDGSGGATAVLIDQQVIGVKTFTGDDGAGH